jgi:putative ABC transport system permease protein
MTIWQDLKLAARVQRRNPKFTIVAVTALACGIGANTVAFTVVNAITRGLPVDEPDRIVRIGVVDASQRPLRVSPRELEEWRAASKTFAGLGAFSTAGATVSEQGRSPEPASAAYVSANTFGLLGDRPLLGREILAEDDRAGAPVVAVLGHAVWRSRFNSDPSVLGRSIAVDGLPATVVGVMREGFRFPVVADLWLPLSAMPGYGANRNARALDVFGRLAPGSSAIQARAELEPIAVRINRDTSEPDRTAGVMVSPFTGDNDINPFFIGLMVAVSLVLVIACINVANLLIARVIHRTRETAVRLAHGATRWLVIRQLLVESALLSTVASVLGVALAVLATRLLSNTLEGINLPYWIQWTMDGRVFAYIALMCVLSAAISGLWPALHLTQSDVIDGLRAGGRSATLGRRPRRLVRGLLAVELAFTLVLLAGAGLMMRSFMTLYRADLVIDPTNVLSMRIALPLQRYQTRETQTAFFQRLEEQLGSVSVVRSVALANAVPFIGAPRGEVSIEGRSEAAGAPRPNVSIVSISRKYFETLGVSLTRGRPFSDVDARIGSEGAIVNERFASMFFAGQDAVGKRIRLSGATPGSQGPWRAVVGVAPSTRQQPTLQLEDLDPVAYVPRTATSGSVAWLLVRGAPSNTSVPTIVREQVWALDPDLALARLVPLDETISQSRWTVRVFAAMFVAFAWIAVVLAAVGLYAVTAYSVTQRSQEVGVRMALGAQRGEVVWLFVRGALMPLGVGLVAGIAGALALGPLLRAFLVQTSPSDPATLAAVAGMLIVVAGTASVLPARRATRVDPVIALRGE